MLKGFKTQSILNSPHIFYLRSLKMLSIQRSHRISIFSEYGPVQYPSLICSLNPKFLHNLHNFMRYITSLPDDSFAHSSLYKKYTYKSMPLSIEHSNELKTCIFHIHRI